MQQIEAAELTLKPRPGRFHTFQHVVEGVGQKAKFMSVRPGRPDGVIAVRSNCTDGGSKREDRLGYQLLQTGGNEVGHCARDSPAQGRDESKALEPVVEGAQVRLQ